MQLETPILFLIFNRPDQTAKVFDAIKRVQPKSLFVAADGPRGSHVEDIEQCRKVRAVVTNGVDWDCEVKTLFREENLGCGRGPADAITWFFKNVEEGIILEDDCLPDDTFFSFCENLLIRFRDEKRIMHISGTNLQDGKVPIKESYYFSQYPHSWGWASWRRAWIYFDFIIKDSQAEINATLNKRLISEKERSYWATNFIQVFEEQRRDIWDFQWCYTIWKLDGISILPSQALIENIGFGSEATHTKGLNAHYQFSRASSISTILHPKSIQINREADRYIFTRYFARKTTLRNRLRNLGYRYVPATYYGMFKRIFHFAKRIRN